MEEEIQKLIDFKFEWAGKDFEKIAPNVLETSRKLLELNLIKVETELDEKGNIVILHTGVCKKQGLVESLSSGIVKENIYSYTFSTTPKNSLNCICKGREESKVNFCQMSSCPILVAGYLYYLKNRNDSSEQIIEEFSKDATENDIYARNYNELKKMEFDKDIEEFLSPLSIPSIKGLRTAFIGEEGTDKESTINKIASYLYRIGKISSNKVININLSTIGDPKVNFQFQDDKLYSIMEIQDYLDALNNNDDFSGNAEAGRKVNKNSIKKIVNQARGKYIIINTSPLELKKFLASNAKLPYIFENTIYFKDYEDDRILKMFEENLPEYHKKLIKDETRKTFLSYLERNRKYFPFKNEDLSLFLAGYVSRKNEICLPKERYDKSSLDEMFNNLIGMDNVKSQIRELNNFLLLKNKLEKHGVKFSDFNLHMMFLGNPGTGKTTVARMIAKMLFDLGYIKENKCIEAEAKDLIAAFSGQTPMKTGRVVNSALGGVLFVDEAYSLAQTTGSGGAEAISTLIKAMEDNKGELVVIFAGYSKEMQEFIQANSGIQSRIGYTFEFADYTEDELFEIFKLKSSKIKLVIDDSSETKIRELINFGKNRKNFGNGRYVDNILQKTLTKHASLDLKDNQLLNLSKDSIPTIEEVLTQSSGERHPEKIEELFSDIVGMEALKKQVIGLGNYIKFKKEINKTDGKTLPNMNLHMMFLGNPGTGKTTIARKITQMLYDLDCIRINKLTEVDRNDLVADHAGQTAPKVTKVIDGAMGGVLFIDEAYSLKLYESDVLGNEAIATLIKAMEDHKDELVVIFAGYTKEMQEFIHANSGIKSRIGYTIEFADYTENELYDIFRLKLNKIGFELDTNIDKKILETIKFGKSRKDFGNGRFIDNLLTETLKKHSEDYNKENIFKICKNDIPSIDELMNQASGERCPEKIEELFSDIVGMENVKKQVIELGNYIKFRDELSKISQNTLPDMRLHMLFTGDAGTGKTTMARKITEMLYNIGCIRINKLVEVERKDLVAEFIGQTAPKTEKVIEGALGGVLFIDEAYSLTPKDSFRDFGQEAITTLIKAMEDHRDELVVIFAGYTKEMKDFVNSNSGIASRIGYTFEFENYKDEELYKILEIKCNKYNLIIKDDVKEKVMEVFKYFSSVENFGNGRFVDKILQEILVKHSQNTKLQDNLNVLMINDIPTIKDTIEKTFNNRENLVIPADIDTETRRKIAIHELGHAIIHYIYQGESNLKVITVIPEGNGALGYVLHTIPKTKVLLTKRDYLDEVEELIAGRAAEELLIGADKISTGCWNDLEKATDKLTHMMNDCGLSNTLGLISARNIKPSLEMSQKLDDEKRKTLEDCYENVKKVLQTNRKMFDKVLNELMEKGTLTGEDFVNLIKEKTENKS